MTITHLSHYGLTLVETTNDSAVLSGRLADCKRMAAAHGMEIDRYEGQTISIANGRAVHAPADENRPAIIWYKGSGIIARSTAEGEYTLVMPVELWNERV